MDRRGAGCCNWLLQNLKFRMRIRILSVLCVCSASAFVGRARNKQPAQSKRDVCSYLCDFGTSWPLCSFRPEMSVPAIMRSRFDAAGTALHAPMHPHMPP